MNKPKANLYINPKDGFLWMNECAIQGFEDVKCQSFDHTKLIYTPATMESAFFYGKCMASVDIIVVRNDMNRYSVMVPFIDTSGNGAIYCSILPGFSFKDVYCYSTSFGGREIVIGKDNDDCWGAIEILDNRCTWGEQKSIFMPFGICGFNYETLESALQSLSLPKPGTSMDGPILRRLIDLRDPSLNNITENEYGVVVDRNNNVKCQCLFGTHDLPIIHKAHKSLDEKVEEFKKLLRSTKRDKIEELIRYIDKMGFFIAPGSFKHHRFKGGLVSHSLEVYYKAMQLRQSLIREGEKEETMPVESVILSSLLHDVCKADCLRYNEQLHRVVAVKHGKDHSPRSVRQIGYSGFTLTQAETEAIRWHMGGKEQEPSERKRKIFFSTHPLADIINKADGRSISDSKKRHHPSKVSKTKA